MAYRRRKFIRRRRVVRRRTTARRTRRAIRPSTYSHHFKRTHLLPRISVLNSAVTFGALQFTLNDLPSVAEFTGLYDSYQITGVKLRFLYNRNASESSSAAGPGDSLPVITYVTDQDDGNAPSSIDDVLQYPRAKTRRLDRPFTHFIKAPACQFEVYYNGVIPGYSNMHRAWLDMTNPSIPHYGLKYAIDPVTNSAGDLGYLSVYATYYFACKGPR